MANNWAEPPAGFITLYQELRSGPKEVRISELIELFELDPEAELLNQIREIDKVLHNYRLNISPALTTGTISTARILSDSAGRGLTAERVIAEIERGESQQQEFKSTYQFDLNRFENDTAATLEDLKSEDVRWGVLKNICALLVSGGGRIYIGVKDDGSICGIQHDLGLLAAGRQNIDQFLLIIQQDVTRTFIDGRNIVDYLSFDTFEIDGQQVLRINVVARETLSFVSKERGECELYRRQETRTVQVKIQEMQEFLLSRGNNS